MKKILLGLGALATAIALVPLFAAFEAHVVNVTAQIENALSVDANAIEFGTVFPQEELDKTIEVRLSESFLAEDRVDDVDYVIRQKPKCMNDQGETVSGEVGNDGEITCPDGYELLPLLCRYLSKHPDGMPEPGNDGSLPPFHEIGWVDDNGTPDDPTDDEWVWNDVEGRLANSEQDANDVWTLDLATPCFEGYCAQDWADFVYDHNPDANPDDYIQPEENEHELFGCDLWIEVTGVSESD
jgi:hypothetical protein